MPRYDLLRKLNDKQERCLDRIDQKDPEAKVIDWFEGVNRKGPVVLMSNGEQKIVNGSGYALPHPA